MKFLAFTILTTLGITFTSLAQEFQGVATYQTATSLDMKMDSTSMPPEQQQMIMQMIKKQMQKEYELSFNKTESVYQEVEELDKKQGMGMGFMSMISGVEGVQYKNIKTGLNSRQSEFFSKLFLIRDTLNKREWKLGKETKQIGSYTCYKATVIEPIVSKIYSSEENEDGSHEKEVVDTVEIVAWYTPQIPVGHGPGNFWGLPGLIMEVQNGNTVMLCSKVVLNPKKELKIQEPVAGEVVNQAEFDKIVEDKMKEMEQIYGGGRGGRGGRRGGTMKIQISR